jgi:hypothetical protein
MVRIQRLSPRHALPIRSGEAQDCTGVAHGAADGQCVRKLLLLEVLPGGQCRAQQSIRHGRFHAVICGRLRRHLPYWTSSPCGDVPGNKVTSTTKAATAKRCAPRQIMGTSACLRDSL